MSTIQYGDGEQIENGQIYIDEDHKPEKFLKSNFGKNAEMIHNPDRATHIAKFNI